MARKKQYTPPKVPRSSIGERRVRRAVPHSENATTAGGAAAYPSRPARYEPELPTLAEQYGHVKKDLVRITIFGTLVFAIMFALKFMGI